jgi:UDP-4-amino-4,6-dideoxy-N-acetyl-beta-L-altrosamine N-acetyltransferase
MALRSLRENDLEMVRCWRNSPEVRRFMFTAHEIDPAEHRSWFERIQEDTTQRWFIFENETGLACGVVYFTLPRLGSSALWGFYAAPDAPPETGTRMGLAALDHAFMESGWHKLSGLAMAENSASLRLHEKLGFRVEGRLREEHFDGSRYIDVIRFGILAEEWKAKRPEILARLSRIDPASKA